MTDRTIKTAFRAGWQADYPGLFNFLGPLYAHQRRIERWRLHQPGLRRSARAGLVGADVDEANEYFQQAQEILFKDLPAIPLWYAVGPPVVTRPWSSNVAFDWHGCSLSCAP